MQEHLKEAEPEEVAEPEQDLDISQLTQAQLEQISMLFGDAEKPEAVLEYIRANPELLNQIIDKPQPLQTPSEKVSQSNLEVLN